MIQDFVRALRTQIREEITATTNQLATGRAGSFDEYKRLVGRIQGLELAEEMTNALAKKVETADDE